VLLNLKSAFLNLKSSGPITPADFREGERLLKPPQEAAQSRVLWARILYSLWQGQLTPDSRPSRAGGC
jgi:hypothetical protein